MLVMALALFVVFVFVCGVGEDGGDAIGNDRAGGGSMSVHTTDLCLNWSGDIVSHERVWMSDVSRHMRSRS